MPHVRGKVTERVMVGKDLIVAEIAWDTPDLLARVNVKNLSTVRQITLGE